MTLIQRYLGLIKFEHTIFALPFALISLLVASKGRPEWRVLLWVLVAMVGARSAAMAFNRLADRKLDAANPRTRGRHLPAGILGVGVVALFTAVGAGTFVAGTLLFWPNWIPLAASVPVLVTSSLR